ncbi:MAG: cytochrome c biogenesis CcdA family protein [Acidimicrobiales bacterium]
MISSPILLAFTAGMVATFNPCGFALLPAYIGAFVATDQTAERPERRVLRAIAVAAAVSLGFVIVFAGAGLIIDSLASSVRRQLPWITIAIGGLLIVGGIATVFGWKPNVAIRVPNLTSGRNGTPFMVGYGATYAIASLSCTLGPFLAVTGAALSQSRTQGIATYVSYALGMGVIILILSIAAALAHSTVANHLRSFSRIAPRVGGAFMILAGGYAIWYGRWEIAVYSGDLSSDPLIEKIEDIRLAITNFIETIGAVRLTTIVAIGVIAVITTARYSRPGPAPSQKSTESEQASSSQSMSTPVPGE